MEIGKNTYFKHLAAISMLLSLGACASLQKTDDYANIAKAAIRPTSDVQYDWRTILKGPPESTSSNHALELDMVRNIQKSADEQRFRQAALDNNIDAFAIYGPIIGPDLTSAKKPEIMAVWTYAGRQMARNSNNAKDNFPRQRPFLVANDIKICIDKAPNGSSYPSGHASWGWLSAQILARIYPEKTSEILGRGIDYGYSRVVCGVHFPSDVSDGRLVADSILMSLDRDPEFQRLLGIAIKARK